ncbi:MAG: hypothetical protein KAH67_06835 [Flavobacteriaceae bacterium]|nr:hypothetical protein [Flavobacteriaceae bacterium]
MVKQVVIAVILFFPQFISAQCAMCRAVVEQGGEEVAEGINSGIIYLMAFPYIVIGVSIYLLYRNWKKGNTQ